MDVIATCKYIIILIVGGMVYYFLNMGLQEILNIMNIHDTNFNVSVWIWTLIPIVILVALGWWSIRMQEKKPGGNY